MAFVCRICENRNGIRTLTAREMMYGTREEFEYFECPGCGTVQIGEFRDMSPYYPDDYLAFDSKVDIAETLMRRVAARFVGKELIFRRNLIGKALLKAKPWMADHFPRSLRSFPMGLNFDLKILDFGCGTGKLLRSLHHFGFRNLTGADSFIADDIRYPEGITIYKRGLEELEPHFDLVMLHHSFEHLPNPHAAMHQIKRLIGDSGRCLIRIPVATFAWEKYGTDWVQMDPPRHLFLYTEKAFRLLAEKSGMAVEHVQYDSGPFQFWGSELYRRDIPLLDERSPWVDPGSSLFTAEQMARWTAEAEELNRTGRGDMAAFYLRKRP